MLDDGKDVIIEVNSIAVCSSICDGICAIGEFTMNGYAHKHFAFMIQEKIVNCRACRVNKGIMNVTVNRKSEELVLTLLFDSYVAGSGF